MKSIKLITPQELAQLKDKNIKFNLIDVREQNEFDEVHAPDVTALLPLSSFEPSQIKTPKKDPLYFICRSGKRSYDAASRCAAEGFEEVYNVEGGMLAWSQAGLPTSKKK